MKEAPLFDVPIDWSDPTPAESISRYAKVATARAKQTSVVVSDEKISTSGKTDEALEKSRDEHEVNLAQFGGSIPESILFYDQSDKAIDLQAETRSYVSTQKFKGTPFSVSGAGCEAGALSRFPQNIGRQLLLLYTSVGETVHDPFAGHNSRMELCWRAGRNYYGCDVSEKFMHDNHAIAELLFADTQSLLGERQATIRLHQGDSRKLPMESDTGDFTITSPPYWDIEYYGDEPQQLGLGKTYEQFLKGLGEVAKENHRVLKMGSFCVWCVNDFRRDGKFYSYHEDTCRLLRDAGFVQHDIAITDFGKSFRACFPNQVIEQRILPKRHEYCLIFKKP